jgi:hypothetical protein
MNGVVRGVFEPRGLRLVKKSELLCAIQEEIQRDNPDTFMSADKIVETGCSTCKKHFGTIEQFKRHLTDDVLPTLLDRLSTWEHS